MTKEETDKLREENKRLKEQVEANTLLLSDTAVQKKKTDLERLNTAMQGKIGKGQQWKLLKIAELFEPGHVLELSDPANGQREASPLDLLIEVINAQPLPVQPGILNLGDTESPKKRGFSHLRNKG